MTLQVKHLSKKFKGLQAVSDLSFDLHEGEILGFMGPNGAGKTTVINLVTGLIKSDAGEVTWKGNDITGLRPHQIVHAGVSRTFQQARVFQNMTIRDNLIVALANRPGSGRFEGESREDALGRILDSVEMRLPDTALAKDLTQDNLRRLEIARALSSYPDLLILDEPVSGLTPEECDSIIGIIQRLNNMGISLFIVEHVMRMLMRVSHRLLVISGGIKLCEGFPEDICNNPAVIESYLGDGLYGSA